MSMASLPISASAFAGADDPFVSARHLAGALGISLSDLSRLSGLARNTLSTKAGTRKVDEALSPIVRILAMASDMAGDETRAAIWFKHQPIPGWGGETAYDLVAKGKAGKVLAYLEAVRAGVYA